MQQTAAAIMNLVAAGGGACGPSQLVYGMSDTLVGKELGNLNRGDRWTAQVAELRPDVVVLGAGFHVGTQQAFDEVLHTVRDEYYSLLYGNIGTSRNASNSSGSTYAHAAPQLVWMTTPGASCSAGASPLDRPPSEIEGYWESQNSSRPLFNHQLLEQWDGRARAFWRNVTGASVLDVSPLWKRPDAKVGLFYHQGRWQFDCVHFCMPGPFRTVAQLLQLHLKHVRAETVPPSPAAN